MSKNKRQTNARDYLIRHRVSDLFCPSQKDIAAAASYLARVCRKRLDELGVPAARVSAYALTTIAGSPFVTCDDQQDSDEAVQLHRLMVFALHVSAAPSESIAAWRLSMDRCAELIDMRLQHGYAQSKARKASNHDTRDIQEDAAALLRAGKTRPEAERELQRNHSISLDRVRRHMKAAGWTPRPRGREKKPPKP